MNNHTIYITELIQLTTTRAVHAEYTRWRPLASTHLLHFIIMRLATRIYIFLLSQSDVRQIKKNWKDLVIIRSLRYDIFSKFIVWNFSSIPKALRHLVYGFCIHYFCDTRERSKGDTKRLCSVLVREYCVFLFFRFVVKCHRTL